jgi:hypothetical protein
VVNDHGSHASPMAGPRARHEHEEAPVAVIARTGFFVLCSVFKEHDPRGRIPKAARTRCTRRCGNRQNQVPSGLLCILPGFRGTPRSGEPPQERRANLPGGYAPCKSGLQQELRCGGRGVAHPDPACRYGEESTP